MTGDDETGAVEVGAKVTGAFVMGADVTGAIVTGAIVDKTGALVTGAPETGVDCTGANVDTAGASDVGAAVGEARAPKALHAKAAHINFKATAARMAKKERQAVGDSLQSHASPVRLVAGAEGQGVPGECGQSDLQLI